MESLGKKKKLIYIISFLFFTTNLICFFLGKEFPRKLIHCDINNGTHLQKSVDVHRYAFLPEDLSRYISLLCSELKIDPDLAVSILLQENPDINFEAIHKNNNGTVDLGLWQLNDKYLYTTFSENFWDFDIALNAFDWKHNTLIALHQIEWLQTRLKVQDDVIMAYNCGIGAVMNREIPDSTKIYLSRVKNNFNLLKGGEL